MKIISWLYAAIISLIICSGFAFAICNKIEKWELIILISFIVGTLLIRAVMRLTEEEDDK